mmetsp:Transcript_10296/g.20220  ORF Transcript_10296/g.20220 Transcript_10296/m.20220 type:complete len:441 (-) Transcript_10296:453-1775(-)
MADMDALFKSRKKKGKKAARNFGGMLEAAQKDESSFEPATQVYQKTDEDGRVVVVEEYVSRPAASAAAGAKKVGGLTAAVNASKGLSLAGENAELVSGEWVDEKASKPQSSLLASSSRGVADMDGLTSSMPVVTKSYADLQAEEQNKKLFHRARMQVRQEVAEKDSDSTAAKPEDDKPKVFRPRALMEARGKREGVHALKELDNEAVFPSLGGNSGSKSNTKAGAAKTAWGVVEESVIADILYKQSEGEYLGEDFIAADSFEGPKSGYSFKIGDSGLGYYWECKPVGQDDADEGENAEISAAEEKGAQTEETAEDKTEEQNAVAETAEDEDAETAEGADDKDLSPEEIAAREEKERKRREKKKLKEQQKAEWERQHALALEREREEQEKAEAAPAAGAGVEDAAAPAAAPAAAATEGTEAPPEDRFSGLKKKKKKKAAKE